MTAGAEWALQQSAGTFDADVPVIDAASEASIGDLELVHRAKSGDSEAFSELVRRHQHIIYSVCLTELHRRKRRAEVELTPATSAAVEPVEVSDVPEYIRSCVTKLPDHYATIITLYYLQGISYTNIADVLEIPMGTLKTWMFRARKQLKSIVEKEIFSS